MRRSVDVFEWPDFGFDDDPSVVACLVIDETAGYLLLRPSLRAVDAELALQATCERVERFERYGPAPDGWVQQSDRTSWRLYLAVVADLEDLETWLS